jgi:hypothetical protein
MLFTNSSDFQPWLLILQTKHEDAAKRAETPDNHLRLWGVPKAAPLVDGGAPDLVTAADTAAERYAKEMAFKLRAERMTAKQKANDQDILFKAELLSSSPPEAVAAISDGVTGTLRLQPSDILERLRTMYGTVSATTFELMRKSLPRSCGTSTAEVTAAINKVQNFTVIAASINQPVSDADQFSMVIRAMPVEFDLAIQMFKFQNPTAATRLLAAIRPILIATAEEYSNAKELQVANVALTIKPTSYEDYIANAVALANAAGFQPSVNSSPNAHNRAQTTTAGNKSFSYCWSHGKVVKHADPAKVHTSLNCKVRHPNHVATSTMSNMMGGKTTVWERGQPLGP